MTQTRFLAASALAIASATMAHAEATVAFLMPDQASTRYEQHDYPGFKAAMDKLCPDCTVIYQNANADVALQQQQFNSVIAQGAKVVVLDPVDSSAAAALVQIAHSQDVKVVAYDRPIPDVPADFYVSFDNEGIGRAIAQSLVDHLKASGVADGAGVLQINGGLHQLIGRRIAYLPQTGDDRLRPRVQKTAGKTYHIVAASNFSERSLAGRERDQIRI